MIFEFLVGGIYIVIVNAAIPIYYHCGTKWSSVNKALTPQ